MQQHVRLSLFLIQMRWRTRMMKTRVTTTTKKRNFLIPHKINADKKKERVFSENFLFVQLFLYFFRSFWIKLCTYHLSREIDAIITREKSRQGLSVRLSSHSIRIWVFLLLLTVVHGCLASCQVISPDGSRANTHTHTQKERGEYIIAERRKRGHPHRGEFFFLVNNTGANNKNFLKLFFFLKN